MTDGTVAHTSLPRDFNPGAGNSFPTAFGATGDGHVIFDATDAATGHEVWVTDGTAAGTSMVKDINTVTASSSPAAMTVLHINDAPVAHGIADQSTNEDHRSPSRSPRMLSLTRIPGTQLSGSLPA